MKDAHEYAGVEGAVGSRGPDRIRVIAVSPDPAQSIAQPVEVRVYRTVCGGPTPVRPRQADACTGAPARARTPRKVPHILIYVCPARRQAGA